MTENKIDAKPNARTLVAAADAACAELDARRKAFVKAPGSRARKKVLLAGVTAARRADNAARRARSGEGWYAARPSAAEKAREKIIARARLAHMLPPGSTVYTSLAHVSRSGMMRKIRALVVDEDGEIVNVSAWVAEALGEPHDSDANAVKVGGSGMDMGFHLINSLCYAIHGSANEDMPPVSALRHVPERKRWPMIRREKGADGRETESVHPGYTLRHEWV